MINTATYKKNVKPISFTLYCMCGWIVHSNAVGAHFQFQFPHEWGSVCTQFSGCLSYLNFIFYEGVSMPFFTVHNSIWIKLNSINYLITFYWIVPLNKCFPLIVLWKKNHRHCACSFYFRCRWHSKNSQRLFRMFSTWMFR